MNACAAHARRSRSCLPVAMVGRCTRPVASGAPLLASAFIESSIDVRSDSNSGSQVQTIGAADAHAMMSAHEQTIKGGGRISQSELDATCDLLSSLIQNLQDLLK